MANQHTILPPVVIAGLYKQIVIPKEEAAMLAEAQRASGGLVAGEDLDPGSIPAGTTSATGKTETSSATGSTLGTAPETSSGSNAPETTAKDPAHVKTEKLASLENKIPDTTISTGNSDGSNPALSTTNALFNTTENGGSTPSPGTASQDAPSLSANDPAAPTSTYKILGKNLKHVTIIVRSKKEPFLPEDHLQFLTKMLTACQLNLGDVAIVNDATQKADIQALKAQLEPSRLLLFGVSPSEIGLPLTFPLFKEQEYAGCSYLYSPSLLELNQTSAEARDLKKKLWECLKKMFNV